MRFKRVIKEVFEGVAFGAIIVGMFAGILKVNAAGADTELPELYQVHCKQIGQEYNICPELLMAIIEQESGGNPDAVGAAGEIGLMQIYPKYHSDRMEELGVYSLYAPKSNILVGADYLAELFQKYGDVYTVLQVYNGTEDAVEKAEKGEHTEYARKIVKRAEQLERLHEKF